MENQTDGSTNNWNILENLSSGVVGIFIIQDMIRNNKDWGVSLGGSFEIDKNVTFDFNVNVNSNGIKPSGVEGQVFATSHFPIAGSNSTKIDKKKKKSRGGQ